MGAGHGGPAGALYLHGHTPLHRLPAHVKIVAMLCFVLIVVATPGTARGAFAAYALLLVGVIAVARIPASTVLRRMTVEIPFVFFALLMPVVSAGPRVEVLGLSLSEPGLAAAFTILVKATLGVAASVTLAATTSIPELLLGLQRLRTPDLLVTIATFMLRYSEVVTEEMRRMSVARASRCFDAKGPKQWRVLGHAAGALFIRSYERGERVHLAMLSRGYTGRMPVMDDAPALPSDWVRAMSLPLAAVAVLLVTWVVSR